MASKILTTTDAAFATDILQVPGAVLVDFWADWCGPCKALAPILDDIAEEYAGSLRVAKLNADDNKITCDSLVVRGLPTMVLFIDGVERERLVGTISKTRLAAVIDKHLGA